MPLKADTTYISLFQNRFYYYYFFLSTDDDNKTAQLFNLYMFWPKQYQTQSHG